MMTFRLDQLPACSFRSGDMPHFTCTHEIVRGKMESVPVHYANCQQCKFAGWDAALSARTYRQRVDEMPTRAQFAERVGVCDGCSVRQDNYCPPAGQNCNLTTKLARSSFACPLGKFGSLPFIDDHDEYDDLEVGQSDPVDEPPAEELNAIELTDDDLDDDATEIEPE